MKIPFNRPLFIGYELDNITNAIHKTEACLSANGEYTKKCEKLLRSHYDSDVLLTHSCTSALEICALLLKDDSRDEVIMPSFTFVSTANSFLKLGYKVKFVDIRPETMNINENLVEKAISGKTRAVVAVNYGGIAADLEQLRRVCDNKDVVLIEDAAQSLGASYKGRPLGGFGHLSTLSFHETKNVTAGEGGALIVNDRRYLQRSHYLREKGTNRTEFIDGKVDKYTWVDIGGHYMMAELNAAYLFPGLEKLSDVTTQRVKIWNLYQQGLCSLQEKRHLQLPSIPHGFEHNAHLFYIKTKDVETRKQLLHFLNENGVNATFHYVPLHSSPVGKTFTEFFEKDEFTISESERLLRLPLYFGLRTEEVNYVTGKVKEFFARSAIST